MASTVKKNKYCNINIGILGHVDSGKTSLVKALSTSLSTAALDKSSQSQQRGITLDLGFSAFSLPLPPHLQEEYGEQYKEIQFTLVDCPGHASLIRTIIGGKHMLSPLSSLQCIPSLLILTDSPFFYFFFFLLLLFCLSSFRRPTIYSIFLHYS